MTPDTMETLKNQRDVLSEVYKCKAPGALIRARFQYMNEFDFAYLNYIYDIKVLAQCVILK